MHHQTTKRVHTEGHEKFFLPVSTLVYLIPHNLGNNTGTEEQLQNLIDLYYGIGCHLSQRIAAPMQRSGVSVQIDAQAQVGQQKQARVLGCQKEKH